MMNKKGSAWIVIVTFVILISILIVGFVLSIGSSALGYVSDAVTPIIGDLGMIDNSSNTNASLILGYVTTPVSTLVNALPWIIGFLYVGALLFSVVFVATSKNGNGAYCGTPLITEPVPPFVSSSLVSLK